MSSTGERAYAFAKAEDGDFDKSLRLAENIADAWYRAQSLAAVARYAPEREVVRIAEKSFKAAKEAGDAYKQVAVCAWPIRALVERGKCERAQSVLAVLLQDADAIKPPVSKVCALELIWQAAYPLPAAIKQPVLDAFVAACRADNSWKSGRILSYVVLGVAAEDTTQARRIADGMRDGPNRRWTLKRLNAGVTDTVRGFFSPRRTPQEEAEYLEASAKRATAWEAQTAKRREKRQAARKQQKRRDAQSREIVQTV